MSRWYILDNNHKPVSADVVTAGRWMDNNPNRKIVKQEDVSDDVQVSTVFLGLDHCFHWEKDKTPVLWETMIFGGEQDQYQERYTSYEDALKGHKVAVQIAINSLKTEDNGNTE